MTKGKIARVHPIAQLFPMLSDDKLAELAASIKQTGLLTPITRDRHGILLDGRNRLKACEMAGVEPRFEIYDGDPVGFILSVNIARRQLTDGQCVVIVALAYPNPGKGGRSKSTNVSKLEWFSASRLSEARKIVKRSRDLARAVVAGSCTFQKALFDATATRVVNTDPPVAPTIVTSAELRAATAKGHMLPTPATPHPNDVAAARHRAEIENARSRENLKAHFAQLRDAAQTEPDTAPGRMKDPIEQWLFDWEPETLAYRVIAADRLQPGYAQQVVDATIEKMGAPLVMRH